LAQVHSHSCTNVNDVQFTYVIVKEDEQIIYTLSMLMFHADVTECQNGVHNCSQRCTELEGGFTCACYEGYELEDDKVSCKGTCVTESIMSECKLYSIRYQ